MESLGIYQEKDWTRGRGKLAEVRREKIFLIFPSFLTLNPEPGRSWIFKSYHKYIVKGLKQLGESAAPGQIE
jgi:hypothetical protein